MTFFPVPDLLESPRLIMRPLRPEDFEILFSIASDPKIWEQHPNKDRWQRAIFENFFRGALESKAAYLIYDRSSGQLAGCSRFYDLDTVQKSLFIGYTFYARAFWGQGINPAAKRLMLDHAFRFVDTVHFHVGADNVRSRKAMEKLGAHCEGEVTVAYYGEPERVNAHYTISKKDWETGKAI